MYTFIGIIGAILILLGFWRVTIGQWTGKTFWYEMDNLVGAVLVAIYQVHHHAYVSVVINVVWAVVAIKGLSSYADRKFKTKSK
jgi:hypothetical protein